MWTITCRRFKRDRRGVSNIIVVALSLVIILAIGSNIVLWNYEMTQVDWEKMKEEPSITNVDAMVGYSSWIVAQNEYFVNKGSHTSGSYQDTQSLDSQYETFTEVASTDGWLTDWDKRLKITILSKDIDETLTDFPVLIFLSNSSSGENAMDVSFVFDELQSEANRKKIAVTTSDGITQCYVEIERWNHARELAWLWVKIPSMSNTMDTEFYLYYDSDHSDNIAYVGDPNSAQAENVWENNFKLVTHMENNPNTSFIKDSTLNNNDGTKKFPSNPLQADGKIGKAQNFSADYVNCGTSSTLNILNTLTIEAWINPDTLSTTRQNSIADRGSSWWFLVLTNQRLSFLRYSGGSFGLVLTDEVIPTGTYTHVAVGFDTNDQLEVKLYINGELSTEGSLDGSIDSSNSALLIGDRGPNVHHFDGTIDEVRISNTERSAAWIKASYENERNDLLDFGIEERLEERNALEIVGIFTIDPSTYPLTNIQTVEIQLNYNSSDINENWFLKAYNWTASAYNDSGFNITTGHMPTTGWDYYVVNLTDGWESYVHNNGSFNVMFVDQGTDSEQTTVDIDFLGVRVKIDGAQFTFENNGALTLHLVSLWMINSTDHQHYDINIFVNSATTKQFVHNGISIPSGNFTVKVVTERGNTAVYSGS